MRIFYPMPEEIRSLVYQRKLYDVVRIAVDMGLFSRLGSPATPEDVADGADATFVRYLLDALAAFGYVDRSEHGGATYFTNTAVSRIYLDRDSAAYIGDAVFAGFDTYEALREYVDHGADDFAITTAYWTPGILENIGAFALLGHVQDTVSRVDLSGRGTLLDIGGGHGLYSIFFTKKYPELRASVLDLPAVLKATRKNIKKFGAGRVRAIAGDIRDLKPGRAYDAVFISNVVDSYGELCALIAGACGLLAPGGLLVLRNYVADAGPDGGSAIVKLERYIRRGRRNFTVGELHAAMESAGLSDIKVLSRVDGVAIMSGKK